MTASRFFSIHCALVLLVTMVFSLPAQEDPLHRTQAKPSPAGSPASSPESTTPPLTSAETPPSSPAPPQLTDVLFKNLKARSIGPAVMGGRVSDIALDPHNPFVFYVGLAHGGVFKTEDNGVSFDPIFDKQPVLSIGAVAVAPSDSTVIWVGTGEANDRNSSGWGNGVYRSTDGGAKLAERRVEGESRHWANCRPSIETGSGIRRRERSSLGRWRRARSFQDD